MTEEFRGFSIPFRFDPATGGVVQASGTEKIKENIVHILMTGVGERVMRRDYGGGIRQLVHDPNNDALRALVQHQIAKSIGQWEPRVQVQNVVVSQQKGTLIVQLHYIIRQTGEPQDLTAPIGSGGL